MRRALFREPVQLFELRGGEVVQARRVVDQVRVGELVIDVPGRGVSLDGKQLVLTGVEFDILLALARRAGRVVPRESLLSEAGRGDVIVSDRTVDVHISHLRQKLGDDPRAPRRIKTVRGIGYILVKEPS